VFLVDAAHGAAAARVHGNLLGSIRPASGFIVVKGSLDPRWLIDIEADAIVGGLRFRRDIRCRGCSKAKQERGAQ
jgi:hypothetical protein